MQGTANLRRRSSWLSELKIFALFRFLFLISSGWAGAKEGHLYEGSFKCLQDVAFNL